MGFFDLSVHCEVSLHTRRQPAEYIAEYTGYLRYHRKRDGRTFRVGKLHAYHIQADRAANDGVSLFEVCAGHSQALHDLHITVFDQEQDIYREEIQEQFTVVESDCLVIDYVVLHPKWRGLKLGLVAIRKAVDLLSTGCGLTVCAPALLERESVDRLGIPPVWLPQYANAEERRGAVPKLRRYLKRLGFRRIGRSPFYALSMTHVAPSMHDLLKPAL
jgi:hypothetical protein